MRSTFRFCFRGVEIYDLLAFLSDALSDVTMTFTFIITGDQLLHWWILILNVAKGSNIKVSASRPAVNTRHLALYDVKERIPLMSPCQVQSSVLQ